MRSNVPGLCCAALVALAPLVARAEAPRPPAPAPIAYPGTAGAPLSLAAALERYRRESLQVEAARLGVEAVRADVISAGLLANPNLAVTGTFFAHGDATGAEESFAFTVDQVIPIAGQLGLREEVARGLATAAERDFAGIVYWGAADVRDAFLDLQVAQAKWRALQAGLADLDKAQLIVAERAAAGANPQYDLARVQVERSNLLGDLAEATAQLAHARAALAKAIGRSVDPASLVAEDGIPEAPDPPADAEPLVAEALRQRPDLVAARTRAAANETRVKQVRREVVPSPDVAVGYQPWFRVPLGGGEYGKGGAIYAGVTLPLPIWDRGQGRIERASAEAQQARVQAEASEVSVRVEVQRAAFAMQARVGAWRTWRDTAGQQVEKLRGMAETAYREGKSGVLELLDAYRAYLGARQREIDLRAGAWQSALDLERALGPKAR